MPETKELTVEDRIRYLISQSRLSQARFAHRLGISPANLSKYLNGKLPVSNGLINRIVADMGVSKLWLSEGCGVPYERPGHHNVMDVRPVPTMSGQPVPVYDIDVTAGCVDLSHLLTDDRIMGCISLPDIAPDCAVVRVKGNSMAPVINSGGFVAIRRISNPECIFWGQIYVIMLEDYRMVKYLRRHPEDSGKVILRSANPDYDDMEVNRKDIIGLYLVETILNFDVRC